MAVTATVVSTDNSVTVVVLLDQNDQGQWVLDITPTVTAGDNLIISINGEEVSSVSPAEPST